ncbi:MAG: DinB family protein [Actinomycetota bacterium]
MMEPKAVLQRYLGLGRDAVRQKLDGLGEYDVRRPLTPTGTNLLGLVKHLAHVELGYFGDTFGRPHDETLAWSDDDPMADMFAAADESRDDVVGLYERAIAHADATIAEFDLDHEGAVPWWPDHVNPVSLHMILVHVATETHRHAGHADILRESLDRSVGLNGVGNNVPAETAAGWLAHVDRVDEAARAAANAAG